MIVTLGIEQLEGRLDNILDLEGSDNPEAGERLDNAISCCGSIVLLFFSEELSNISLV